MRVISGTLGGRRFDAPQGRLTRPTTDRVKEALFGVIHFDLPNSTVLDLFSGSGSLGIEAISRGARFGLFNDVSNQCAAHIKNNLDLLGIAHKAEVTALNSNACLAYAKAKGYVFDVVFLDPPYGMGLEYEAVSQIAADCLLAPLGVIVVEQALKQQGTFDLPVVKSKKYGDSKLVFLKA